MTLSQKQLDALRALADGRPGKPVNVGQLIKWLPDLLAEVDRLAAALADAQEESERRLDALIKVRADRESAEAALAEERAKVQRLIVAQGYDPARDCQVIHVDRAALGGSDG